MKISSVGSYSGSMRLKSSCGKYGETTYQSVHAESKRFYGENGLFFRNTEYSFSHRLMVSETLIYRELINLFINNLKTTRSMKKLLNVLAIVANIAIITGLVSDTCHRVGAARRKKEVTPSLDDEYDEV